MYFTRSILPSAGFWGLFIDLLDSLGGQDHDQFFALLSLRTQEIDDPGFGLHTRAGQLRGCDGARQCCVLRAEGGASTGQGYGGRGIRIRELEADRSRFGGDCRLTNDR